MVLNDLRALTRLCRGGPTTCHLYGAPVSAVGGNHRQIARPRKGQKQARTVAVGCHRLPEKFHGKQGVCRGLPAVAEGPLPEKEGVDDLTLRRYFLLPQSGQGHWSQPQPVHASRIMQRFYRATSLPAPR